jgi:rhodanese-related sulfurtransferase
MKSAILLSLLFFAVCTGSTFAADTPIIAPAEAAKRVADGKAVLIDVREPDEWAETGVAAPAALLPLSDLNGDRKQWKGFLEKNSGKELILYCRTGHRAGVAAKLLAKEGFRTANAGGFRDWQAAGLPVRKGVGPGK